MRKILAGFMAAAMVTSICATASLAVGNTSATAVCGVPIIGGGHMLQKTAFTASYLSFDFKVIDKNGITTTAIHGHIAPKIWSIKQGAVQKTLSAPRPSA